jgi:hypothetical protein
VTDEGGGQKQSARHLHKRREWLNLHGDFYMNDDLNINENFKMLVLNPAMFQDFLQLLDMEISLPNIPMPTMGGEVFWDTLAEYKGWKLQQNEFTKHCRILDADNVRRAWGTKNGMIKALDSIKMLAERY